MVKKKLTLEDVLVPKEEIPYEVPENWCWAKLGSISNIISGGTPRTTVEEYYKDGNVSWITPADLSNYNEKYIYEGRRNITQLGLDNSSAKLLPKDSILLSSRAPIGYVAIAGKPLATNQGFKCFEPSSIYLPRYAYWYLKSATSLIESFGSGTTFKEISGKKAALIPMPIPPLAEQERIVKRIEGLFNKVDKASELVDEARDGFEKRRAAILERAFCGELTRKWREENDFSVEFIVPSIEELNKAEKKNFEFSEASIIFDLPNNWKWMKLKDLCTKFKYGTSAKSQPEGDIPVLRMGNLQGGFIDWNNLVYTSNEDEIKKYELVKGDLLFNRTNSPELVGKTSIYMGEREAIYAGYLIRVRTYEGVNSRYINYFMNSTFAKARCYEVKTDGVSQSNINAEKLGDFDIPLPSIEEQNEIVRILDGLLDKERDISEVSDVYDSIDVIKKSILAKAFRGEFGSNDLEEESSKELLKELIK